MNFLDEKLGVNHLYFVFFFKQLFTLRGLPNGRTGTENKFVVDRMSLNSTIYDIRFQGIGGGADIVYNRARRGWELRGTGSKPDSVLANLVEADTFPIGLHKWNFSSLAILPLMLHKVSQVHK